MIEKSTVIPSSPMVLLSLSGCVKVIANKYSKIYHYMYDIHYLHLGMRQGIWEQIIKLIVTWLVYVGIRRAIMRLVKLMITVCNCKIVRQKYARQHFGWLQASLNSRWSKNMNVRSFSDLEGKYTMWNWTSKWKEKLEDYFAQADSSFLCSRVLEQNQLRRRIISAQAA